MGGGPSSSSQSTSLPIVPPFLRNLIKQSSAGWLQGLQAAEGQGGLASLLQPNPEQIAPLTSDEMANISQLQGIARQGLTPEEQQASGAYSQFLDTTPGNSPATQAAMRNWQMNVQPTIESGLASAGGGRGGELAAALQQGQTAAYAPLAAQDEANQLAAAGGLTGLGQIRSGNIGTAMNASDQIRQIQQAQNTANFQDFMRRSGLMQNFIQGPTSQLAGNLFGQSNTGSQSSGGGKFLRNPRHVERSQVFLSSGPEKPRSCRTGNRQCGGL